MRAREILHPHALVWFLGQKPSTRRLRRRSADVVAVWLLGYPIQIIAEALSVNRLVIEDAIRWEMRRREKKRVVRA